MDTQPQRTQPSNEASKNNNLYTVTPLSKYLAMALFIILPFVGGWIGYELAPEKIIEIEEKSIVWNYQNEKNDVLDNQESDIPEVATYTNSEYGFSFEYPANYGDLHVSYFPDDADDAQSLLRLRSESDDVFVAILYGSDYDSGTDAIKSPICLNDRYSALHDKCIERINDVGTTYYEINLDMIYGPEQRFEFFVNEDLSLIISDQFHANAELNEMIRNSFMLMDGI